MFNYNPVDVSTTASDVEAMLDVAWGYINQQNVPKAEQACLKINQTFPQNADGWYARSFLAFQLKQTTIALSTINKAISLQPTNPQWILQKVNTLLLMRDKTAAVQQAQNLKNIKAKSLALCNDLALMFTKLVDYEQASNYYQQALALMNPVKQPKASAQLYFNLASIERYQGNISSAEQHLNQAIALNPSDYEAYLLRASLKKQSLDSNNIQQLKKVLKQGIQHPIAKAQVHYALAKEQEDLSLYAESFEQLNQGAKVRRDHMRYDVKTDLLTLKQIRKTFDKKLLQQPKAELYTKPKTELSADNKEKNTENNQAIFILGLPRTGSTLVERIVGNHSDVYSAGELNNFALCMMEEIKKLAKTPPSSRAELIALSSQIDFKVLGESYINSTRPETGNTKHFIDKLPLNSLYVGLIHLALPKAKIIHVTRHPLDTCYAIYKQLFTNGYPFSYQLTDLAQYYIEHHKMMQHWYSLLPDVIHQVSYEDVVQDVTGEAKRLISYCQLDWQAQCSEFQNNTAPSTTASASQVRQKIYQSSKGQWRNYQQELQPIKQRLEQAGIGCD